MLGAFCVFLCGCPPPPPTVSGEVLIGEVHIDGSSTVAPITSAMAEEFSRIHRRVRVPVGTSGTGGGFKKFSHGEIDICNASRPIQPSEIEACRERGIDYLELSIALDGITIAVHPENNWVQSLSVSDLERLWRPHSDVRLWSDLNPAFPAASIKLFGPDTDSGTFEFFTEAICHKKGASRSDYQQSGDDNFLVIGVAGDRLALGYFGFAYYLENQSRLRVVPIADGGVAVAPSTETIRSGEYSPLSRPLYVYVRRSALGRPVTQALLRYCFSDEARELVVDSGYIPLSLGQMEEQRRLLEEGISQALTATPQN